MSTVHLDPPESCSCLYLIALIYFGQWKCKGQSRQALSEGSVAISVAFQHIEASRHPQATVDFFGGCHTMINCPCGRVPIRIPIFIGYHQESSGYD
jgi:hypothetical protein